LILFCELKSNKFQLHAYRIFLSPENQIQKNISNHIEETQRMTNNPPEL